MPIFFLPGNYWDAATLEYGFVKENLSGIEIWYREAGSYFQLVLLNLIFLLYKFTFLSHDFLFDLLTVLLDFGSHTLYPRNAFQDPHTLSSPPVCGCCV